MNNAAPVLRIGVDARSLLCREPRGEGKSLLRLYREILALEPKIEVLLFGDQRAEAFRGELPQGVRVFAGSLPGERLNSWENVLLPWLAWRHRCQVLHSAGSSAPRFSAVPVLMTVHDLVPILFDDGQDARFKARFRRGLKNGLAVAQRVITVSESTRQDLHRTFPRLRMPVEVVHWGADDCPPTTGHAPTTPYLVAFGGEALRKNTQYMLERFVALAPRMPTLRLVLVGISARWQRDHIDQVLARAGVRERVDVPGFVPEAELDFLVRHARAVLYLSLYEGFGLPVLETIGRGVPVVASNRSSIPEILKDVPGALPLEQTAAVEEAILQLVTNDAVRRQWITQQGGILPHFRWSETASRTLRSLHAVAARVRP
jgi:glycosyltransferase involved in cell wall biosynthesis